MMKNVQRQIPKIGYSDMEITIVLDEQRDKSANEIRFQFRNAGAKCSDSEKIIAKKNERFATICLHGRHSNAVKWDIQEFWIIFVAKKVTEIDNGCDFGLSQKGIRSIFSNFGKLSTWTRCKIGKRVCSDFYRSSSFSFPKK